MTRFSMEDADRAYEEWGANCGPGALAAIMDMTIDEVRPFLVGFDAKRYTNPTMMFDALRSIGRPWREIGPVWPDYGLVRVQWEGPWTDPGVPIRARYRYTHWIGTQLSTDKKSRGIFDINCMNNGTGWCSLKDWDETIAPHLMAHYKRSSGKWHITHGIEVERPK